jgi:exodeoxyribonuclease VII large subunit
MTPANTQSSLFDAPRPGSNMPEFTVSEVSRALKKTVEDSFGLVRVRGEISECKYHSNGHIYITLKDETAVIAAVCWRGQAGKLGIRPEIGMEVICTGGITTYAGQSKYQLVIQGMALAGVGALLKLLEDRKKKLAAEGLFDAARKRPLPFLPSVIGVITSPTGAVIRDILHRLDDRFPRHVLVWPVAVQGEGAAAQIVAAITGFNALTTGTTAPRPDILIVARGGGSVEDLMAFNDEAVVRAAAASQIPIISAVGHETDTTLIDFVADRRAPTPTAAAEMAVPVRANLLAQVMDDDARLFQAMRRMVADRRERLVQANRALGDPMRVIEPLLQRLDERFDRLAIAGRAMLDRRYASVVAAGAKLRHPRDVVQLCAQKLQERFGRLQAGRQSLFERSRSRVVEAAARLRHPRDAFKLAEQRLGNLEGQLVNVGLALLKQRQQLLDSLGAELNHLSPRAVLGRGYALVQNAAGQVVSSSKDVKASEQVRIEWADGVRGAEVKS